VAIMVVLLPASEGEPSLRPAVVSKLAQLGITSVAVVRDDETVGLVIEGWAFDPLRSADAVVDAIAATSRPRTLHPLLDLAVSASTLENGGELP
jgi:hypothetical protein